jgi:hypothetical protein
MTAGQKLMHGLKKIKINDSGWFCPNRLELILDGFAQTVQN